ncbi:hypothetical protein RDV89_00575 [Nocardioides zeae]|uniref:Uncharacterized protein n=1 Tax=Nocardioides imazamoxiresistens TaxID=3231893 RepID=A0ABU3PRY3_9ACTN|nr:hypothetical protein [Nocardioides zeae]MDT9591540.1 hypothetical protein [Nocardioides zeae]
MTDLHLPMVTDETTWADPDVAVEPLQLPRLGREDWLADRPSAFATDHDDLRLVVTTNRGYSRCGTEADFDDRALLAHVPMGYTDLSVLEKRAVVASGRVVRLWPGPRAQAYALTTAGADGRPLPGPTAGLLWHALQSAVRWSALLGARPLLVTTTRSTRAWH